LTHQVVPAVHWHGRTRDFVAINFEDHHACFFLRRSRRALPRAWPWRHACDLVPHVTYPLATTMLSVPGAKTVRGFSFFGDSFVYVLFEDGTDLYWARSHVLEYLNQVQGRLPATAKPALGPDATGVGWIFQYALVDRTGKNDLAQLAAVCYEPLRFFKE